MGMKKTIIFTLLFMGAWCSTLLAQPAPEPAFVAGEKLSYVVSYRAKLVPNTEVAGVTLQVSGDTKDGVPLLHVNASGRVFGFFRWFFDLNDQYDTWLDPVTLRPIYFGSEIREAGYRFSSYFHYDWDRMKVHTRYRNHKNPEESKKTMDLTDGSYDAIALFYNLRSSDLSQMKDGESHHLKLVIEDTIRTIRYRFIGRERKRIKDWGQIKTLKFACQLATSTGESFEDGSEFFVWITDDPNRIPVLVESPIRVGSIRARLVSFENLKYPDNSVL